MHLLQRLTRQEMVDIINGKGVVIFDRQIYRTTDSLPTQEQIDAYFAALDAAGGGDIKSDGTVPFAANQSMGGFSLTNVADPTSAQGVATKRFIESALATVSGRIPTISALATGGGVIWESAYTFRVGAATYYINGILYSSAEQTITLDAAHATLDRIDVLALNTAGTLVKITGIAAAQPSEPDYDPSTQLKLTFVLVAANTTQPAGVSNENIYTEGSEWTGSTSGSGFTLNSTNNPRTGTKDIEGTAVANNAYVQLQRASTTVLDGFTTLALFIRSKATWNSNRVLRIQFFNAGVAKGNALTIADGFWNFQSSNTTSYQLVAIPIAQFVIPANTLVNQLRITDSGGSIGFYIDDIILQIAGTTVVQVQSGLSQDQGDARYVLKSTNIARVVFEFGDGKNASSLEASQLSRAINLPAGTITSATIEGDVSGSAVVDIRKSTADPPSYSSIAASAKPTLSSDIYAKDITLTGWTKTIAAGNALMAVLESVTTCKQVTVVIEILKS